MSKLSSLYEIRPVQEDEIGAVCREVFEVFTPASYTLAQLNLTRQEVEDWMHYELDTEWKRSHCLILIHKPTAVICGVAWAKPYSLMSQSLPAELGRIAPRHYCFQQIRIDTTKKLGLNPNEVVYGEVACVNPLHRGSRLALFSTIKVFEQYAQLGYTSFMGETVNSHMIENLSSWGIRIVGELNTSEFVLNGTKPFAKDLRMNIVYGPLSLKPKL